MVDKSIRHLMTSPFNKTVFFPEFAAKVKEATVLNERKLIYAINILTVVYCCVLFS